MRTLTEAFAFALVERRLQCQLSQIELAHLSRVDPTYPSLMERGLRCPTISVFVRLCDALSIPPSRMMVRVLKIQRRPGPLPTLSRLPRLSQRGGEAA